MQQEGNSLKELKANIRERRLNEVVRALRSAGATAVTVVKTVPMGADVQPEYLDVSRAVPQAHFTPLLKLELVCDDRHVDQYVNIIRDEARTGERRWRGLRVGDRGCRADQERRARR